MGSGGRGISLERIVRRTPPPAFEVGVSRTEVSHLSPETEYKT
jgi:hypothetical protein